LNSALAENARFDRHLDVPLQRICIREKIMKNELLASVAFLAIASLFVCGPSLPASSPVDSLAVEAVARKADADWAAVASTPSVDAWTSFYDANAIVLLPNDQLASGKELVRQTVSRLLALPHFSVAWRPIEVKVPRSGDLAFLIGAYELRFDDSHGVPVSDRGRRLEIWRKQADGTWKCFVDTWSVDAPIAASSATPPASAQAASPTTGSAPPLAETQPPPPATALESGPPAPARGAATKYGDIPLNYEEAIRKYYLGHLKHPESVQYREVTQPQQGYTTEVTGGLLMREKREYGWTVKATIDAKDSHNIDVGFKTYTFLFRGEKIVDARLPLPGGEMN
jgi:ketosteroid isomerase-like protein